MSGFALALTLFGIVCGNLGAVLVKPLNLGLWWNSVAGALGGAAVTYAPLILGPMAVHPWYYELMAAGGAGLAVMILCGALVALRYRD